MRELCRLQTFPDEVTIIGNIRAVQKQVGNAVPSLLAEKLARQIRYKIFGENLWTGPCKLLPAEQKETPKAARTIKVPKQYRDLIGDHEAHPGTGKGYRATAQAEQS